MGDIEARFQLGADVVTHHIDEGLLVVDLDSGKTWKLNHVGAAVCRGLEQGADLAHITTELAGRYGMAIETVRRDVETLVDSLCKEGLVTPVRGG
ncbi:MAG TPA: PqqD family protein [Polyangia bacterium]|jgi:hypothetical protein